MGEAMKWQPIETAKIKQFDKEHWYMAHSDKMLVFVSGSVAIGHYGFTSKGRGRWLSGVSIINKPTHWMPLPPPPSPDTAAPAAQEQCKECCGTGDSGRQDNDGFGNTYAVYYPCQSCNGTGRK